MDRYKNGNNGKIEGGREGEAGGQGAGRAPITFSISSTDKE